MSRLLILKGLPGSGKSTFAQKLVSGNIHDMAGNWVRVNNDDIRAMMHFGKWSKYNEELVAKVRDFIIEEALKRGDNVIVDNLNLHLKHKVYLEKVAKRFDAKLEEKFFDVDVDECIKRDLKRPNSVGEKVIREWYDNYLAPKHR